MSTDWLPLATAVAAVVTAAGAGIAAVITIRSNEQSIRSQLVSQAAENRKQQLADMAAKGLGYLTGGSQNRSVGIAALKMMQANSLDFSEDNWILYREGIRSLLYAQLLYVYMHAGNRWESHEAANLAAMSEWLLADFKDLPGDEKKNLADAMKDYCESAKARSGNVSAVRYLITKLPIWIKELQPDVQSGLSISAPKLGPMFRRVRTPA